jgi:hypothetical protein
MSSRLVETMTHSRASRLAILMGITASVTASEAQTFSQVLELGSEVGPRLTMTVTQNRIDNWPEMHGFPGPQEKPPFPGNGLIPPGDSVAWLLESAVGGASTREYLVLDVDGTYHGRQSLTASSRIVWATPTRVFLTRSDENDLWWLELYDVSWSRSK